jgi:MFS family permease
MNLPHQAPVAKHRKVVEDLKEGWQYVVSSTSIRSMLSLLAITSLIGGCYSVLLPVYASSVFRGNAGTLGLLYSAVGLGAVAAGMVLAARKSLLGIGSFVAASSYIFGAALLGLAVAPALWLALIVLAFVGFGAMALMTATNTLIQSLTDDHMRGRVMAFFTMAFIGTMPFGSFAAGVAAELVGPRIPILVGGVAAIAATFAFLRILPQARAEGRPILAEKGLIPTDAMIGDLSCREATQDAQPSTLIDKDRVSLQ